MPKITKIISWNVNGIRGAYKKGMIDWLTSTSPDILCLQETKAAVEQLPKALAEPEGYYRYWNTSQQKGRSGVAIYTKIKPVIVDLKLGIEKFDNEGRFIRLDFKDFVLINVYFPNGKASPERLKFKLEFYEFFLEYTEKLRKNFNKLIFLGDVNTAHEEMDIARPKANEKISGFLPIERKWIDKAISFGYVDTFRHFYPDKIQYSWWDLKTRARERNVGWRIDYVFVTKELLKSVKSAYILSDVIGSDHCPVGIDLETTE
ncbi:MAG: exodeoxyribonuclease III [Desulfomonilaceae bacterium]